MRVHHHVQHRPILDIGARADANPVDVATNHDARPDTRVLANRNVADNYRVRVDVGRRRYVRCSATVTANHARTPREIKQVKLTHAPAADKEGQVKLISLAGYILWILLMIKAYQGTKGRSAPQHPAHCFRLDFPASPGHLLWLCTRRRILRWDGGGGGKWQNQSRFVCVFMTDASTARPRRRCSIVFFVSASSPGLSSISPE